MTLARSPLKRTGSLKRRKSFRRAGAAAKEWRAKVLAPGRCLVCGASSHLDPHHVTTSQTLRHYGLEAHVWDERNGVPVCRRCHTNHHSCSKPIPRRLLPQAAIDFATELGLEWKIERAYS